MVDKAKTEHSPVSPAEPSDLLTRIVGFGREVLTQSSQASHTPRTNLAHWGEGCRPYVVTSDLPGVISNVARFREEIERSSALRKRLAYARS